MQQPYLHREYGGPHTVRYRKRRRSRNYRKSIIFIVFIAIIVALVSLVSILHFSKSKIKLVGIWVYDEYTQYVFDESGHGKLLADDISYEYTYKIEGKKVIIDFTDFPAQIK